MLRSFTKESPYPLFSRLVSGLDNCLAIAKTRVCKKPVRVHRQVISNGGRYTTDRLREVVARFDREIAS